MSFLRNKFVPRPAYNIDLFVLQAAFLFTVVGTTGFLGILAGQLPGVCMPSTLLFCSVCVFIDHERNDLFLEVR